MRHTHTQFAFNCSNPGRFLLGAMGGALGGVQVKMSHLCTGKGFYLQNDNTWIYPHDLIAAVNHAATQPNWRMPTSTGMNRCDHSSSHRTTGIGLLDLHMKVKKKKKKNPCGQHSRCLFQ